MDILQPSGHDNQLISYCVDAQKKQIILHTASYPYHDPETFQDFIFNDVLAYHFECDLLSNIIDEIKQVSLESVCEQYLDLFLKLEPDGWPMIRNKGHGVDDLLIGLRERNIRAYELSATMGLRGWVWAQDCYVQTRAS